MDVSTKTRVRKPATVPLLYAIEPHLLNIGRRKAYEQARSGELVEGVPIISNGDSRRVPTAALERVLEIELDVDDLERWQAERREEARAAAEARAAESDADA